jgi:hypothetical protein
MLTIRQTGYGALGIEGFDLRIRTAVIYDAPDKSFRRAGLVCQGCHVVMLLFTSKCGPGVFIQTPGLIGLLANFPHT